MFESGDMHEALEKGKLLLLKILKIYRVRWKVLVDWRGVVPSQDAQTGIIN